MSLKTAPEPGSASPALRARPWSLAARLTAWYAGSALVLLLAATGFLYWVLVANLDREDDQFLAHKIQIVRTVLKERADDLAALKQEAEWEGAGTQHGRVYVRILDEDGRTIIESPGMKDELGPDIFPKAIAVDAEPGGSREVHGRNGKSFQVLAAEAVSGNDGKLLRLIQVALDRTYEEDLLAGYRRSLWLILAIAVVVTSFAGYRIARHGLRPVVEIAETASRIRSTTLHERIDGWRLPAELSDLAATFNDMLDRLQDSFNRLSRFSADIAHELRTPVNNLRGEAEVALGKPRSADEYREVLGSCLEECARLTRMIDSLLFLARAESPRAELVTERVQVGQELAAVRDFYEAAAADAGITLTTKVEDGIEADVDRTLFQRALGNLVANSLAHTPPGGQIQLTACRVDGSIRVTVRDTGAGIPREHLPHVFDRFYRADDARSSRSGRVGLGLAIVKSIAALHRGSLEISSEVGRGTSVALLFPAKRPPVE
jgi:two-component system heavy metal sensor histidine kinase CusS